MALPNELPRGYPAPRQSRVPERSEAAGVPTLGTCHSHGRWCTVRYALDSRATTLHLCLIMFVMRMAGTGLAGLLAAILVRR
jgi:hypothetical protein